MAPLQELQESIKNLPGWKIEGNTLRKDFEFLSFADAMIFINELAQTADDVGHYPLSIDIRGRHVIISLVSEDGTISQKDLALAQQAQKIDSMVRGI